MGDILHSIPGASALRRAHPDWVLGWAVEPRWEGLFRAGSGAEPGSDAMPLVDRVHLVNAKGWARRPLHPETLREIAALRRELREARYDVCVDLQGAVRSALIGRSAGAARMIGEAEPRESAAKWFFGERARTTGRHVIEQSAEVLSAIKGEKLGGEKLGGEKLGGEKLGEGLPAGAALLPRDAAADAWADSLLGGRLTAPFAVVNPGAGWGAKRWPVERYGAVARGLAALGYGVAVNAGPEEVDLAGELVAASGGAAFAVAPSMAELIALMRRASLAIAGDTGPLHLACALGKPVVGIFGPTDPARNGPYGCDFRVLRHPESKRDHSRRSEPEAGLLTITPEAVLAAAAELLGGRA